MSPEVVAICLTADRQELTERAVRCFEMQTYSDAWMLVYDTGRVPFSWTGSRGHRVLVMHHEGGRGATIGELRNLANQAARRPEKSQIFLHWDSDDWYHPEHVEHLVAALQQEREPRLGAVGYNQACFWRRSDSTAWRYTHASVAYAIGASLCYWASCWDQHRFESTSAGEDTRWLRSVRSQGLRGFDAYRNEPLMIAELHGGNTSSHRALEKTPLPEEFQRVPEWDERVKRILETA